MKWQDIFGWFPAQNAETMDWLIEENEINSVIEIGSFLGRSTAFFAERVDIVTAIDPFLIWDEGARNGDAIAHGGRDFYNKFRRNMEECGVQHKVSDIRMMSKDAAACYPHLKADLVFIDGSHDYDSVLQDINLWRQRANKYIAGDDFDENWPGVKKAVRESFDEVGVIGNIWFAKTNV